ncbi:MAG: glutamine synthetase family protein [Solirubrobacteraceae bacterium]
MTDTAAPPTLPADVDTVRLCYCDLHGVCRGKDVPAEAFAYVAEHGITQTEAVMTIDLRHNIVSGFEHGFRDFRAVPDLATLVRRPDDPTLAWCLTDARDASGEPWSVDPRVALRRACEALQRHGLTAIAATELEFYVVEPDSFRPYVGHDSSVYTVGTVSDPRGVLREIVAVARDLHLRPTVATQEYGRGQYEVNLMHGPALDAADRAFRFKAIAKEVAHRHGLLATAMGQPFDDDEGCGLHLHVSLADPAGANLFDAPSDGNGLSDRARAFAAGVLAHMPALTAILNPTVNAYRRFIADSLAPTHVNWGLGNRLALLRFPDERGAATRAEVRSADGTANPYLALAGVLRAGLDGIDRGLELPQPVSGNPYELEPELLGPSLPASLDAALHALAADEVLWDGLGAQLCATFTSIKRYELKRWRAELARVTEWERREYAHHL